MNQYGSVILTKEESIILALITQCNYWILLYRATRDGFTADAFHSRCDGVSKTITIIKNNHNYVFGGYAEAQWSNKKQYICDSKAFIFSLRRDGETSNHKFNIKNHNNALWGSSENGPSFGNDDLWIMNNSNVEKGKSKLGHAYECRPGLTYDSKEANCFLAGNDWLTSEIEVYQIY